MLTDYALLDAGILIGALLRGDPRHVEARPLNGYRIRRTPSIYV